MTVYPRDVHVSCPVSVQSFHKGLFPTSCDIKLNDIHGESHLFLCALIEFAYVHEDEHECQNYKDLQRHKQEQVSGTEQYR